MSSRLQRINLLSKDNIEKLVNSIDSVFFDIDGVLVHNKTIIAGADNCIAKLRKLGKNVAFVTNNPTTSAKHFTENLKPFGAAENEIVTPNDSLLAYLAKVAFKKDIYVIACSYTKSVLKEAGYNIIDYQDIQPNKLEELASAVIDLSLKGLDMCKNVGAVYIDFDYNVCMGAVQVAKMILNRIDDVLFLSGMGDDEFNITQDMTMTGAKFYLDGIERWTRKKAIQLAKPGTDLKLVLKSRFNFDEDSRVLFVGDNVTTDIEFGVKCDFQTLLMLSGVTKTDQVENWAFPERLKPTYFAQSLAEFNEKIKHL